MSEIRIKECAIVGTEETDSQKMLRIKYPNGEIKRMKIKKAIELCGGR